MIEALYEVAPGFRNDKDEPWMLYLNHEDRVEMRRKRALFLEVNENVENLSRHNTNVPNRRVNLELHLEKRKNSVIKWVAEIKRLKAKAQINKRKQVEAEREQLAKRIRLTETADDEIEEYVDDDGEDVEMEPNEYMPNEYVSYEDMSAEEPVEEPARPQLSFADPNPPPAPVQESYTLPESTIFGDQDEYLRGLSSQDMRIFTDLKPLILKYNCRNRVLKVIENLRAIDKRRDAVNVFTIQVAKLKSK